MGVLVKLSTPNTPLAPDSAARRIVQALSTVEIEVVHFGRDGSNAKPYLWVKDTSASEFESVLDDDPQILEYQLIDTNPDGHFYKVIWEVDSPLVQCVMGADGIILEAIGAAAAWDLKIWFEADDQTAVFQECCRELNIPIEIHRLSTIATFLANRGESITEKQSEALMLAYQRGYFEEPRDVSQRELADELEISPTALGRRLRRGTEPMIEAMLRA